MTHAVNIQWSGCREVQRHTRDLWEIKVCSMCLYPHLTLIWHLSWDTEHHLVTNSHVYHSENVPGWVSVAVVKQQNDFVRIRWLLEGQESFRMLSELKTCAQLQQMCECWFSIHTTVLRSCLYLCQFLISLQSNYWCIFCADLAIPLSKCSAHRGWVLWLFKIFPFYFKSI